MNRQDLINALAFAVAAFPNYPLAEETVLTYELALADLFPNSRELDNAVIFCIKSSEYFPAVAAIRSAVIASRGSHRPSDQPFNPTEFPDRPTISEGTKATIAELKIKLNQPKEENQ
jgi:hypothetical protein